MTGNLDKAVLDAAAAGLPVRVVRYVSAVGGSDDIERGRHGRRPEDDKGIHHHIDVLGGHCPAQRDKAPHINTLR